MSEYATKGDVETALKMVQAVAESSIRELKADRDKWKRCAEGMAREITNCDRSNVQFRKALALYEAAKTQGEAKG